MEPHLPAQVIKRKELECLLSGISLNGLMVGPAADFFVAQSLK
jgi:hypothetical protein